MAAMEVWQIAVADSERFLVGDRVLGNSADIYEFAYRDQRGSRVARVALGAPPDESASSLGPLRASYCGP